MKARLRGGWVNLMLKTLKNVKGLVWIFIQKVLP